MASDVARQTAVHILTGSAAPQWRKPLLYDVVYRIPEPSLKLARDDRQAALWYREERKNAERGANPAAEQPKDRPPVLPSPTLPRAGRRAPPAATATAPRVTLRRRCRRAQGGPTWVGVSLHGKAIQVLVDESGQVLGRRDAEAAIGGGSSGLDE
jgi:hypothetical protein